MTVEREALAGLAALESRVPACSTASRREPWLPAAGWNARRWSEARRWVTNPVLIDLYVQNMAGLGRRVQDPAAVGGVIGSTDMGIVSHLVPSIHPMVAVAPAEVSIHDAAFAEHSASPAADRAVLDAAKALSMTVVDFWLDESVRRAIRTAFDRRW